MIFWPNNPDDFGDMSNNSRKPSHGSDLTSYLIDREGLMNPGLGIQMGNGKRMSGAQASQYVHMDDQHRQQQMMLQQQQQQQQRNSMGTAYGTPYTPNTSQQQTSQQPQSLSAPSSSYHQAFPASSPAHPPSTGYNDNPPQGYSFTPGTTPYNGWRPSSMSQPSLPQGSQSAANASVDLPPALDHLNNHPNDAPLDPDLSSPTPATQDASTPNPHNGSTRQASPSTADKKRRHAISDRQRYAIRKTRRETRMNQKALCEWFNATFNRKITQGQISDILSSKYDRLDSVAEANAPELDSTYRLVDAAYPDLEDHLHEWQRREMARGIHVTGDMLKTRAGEIWDAMDQYHGKSRPAFSNGWLEGYKKRKHSGAHRTSIVGVPRAGSQQAPAPSTNGGVRVAYLPQPGSIVTANPDFYDAICAAPRIQVNAFDVDPRSGRAWKVPAGSIFRISTPFGAQVGDLNIWNMHNKNERFWASRTRQLHASHLSTHDRLWSNLPYLRPMATIIRDTLGPRYGVDENGGRCHDLLGTRCDPYANVMLSGTSYDFHCHSNLVRAVMPYGLAENDIHDVLNVFQVTGLTQDKGQYWMGTSPAIKDDCIEFFAEIDLLCALSTCPGGDLSVWGFDSEAEQRMRDSCQALRVEVFTLGDMTVLNDWTPPRPALELYQGAHGMRIPVGESNL